MEVRFYHLTHSPLERALPALIQKALGVGKKIVLVAPDEGRLNALDEGLWTWDAGSFTPHGNALKKKEGGAEQPLWLTLDATDRANDADMLVLTGNSICTDFSGYTLCCEMLNGYDNEAVEAGRTRWKDYKDKGYDLTYWQQTQTGGWEKKA